MTYQDVKYVTFHSPEMPIGFWIFDHPQDGKMLINQDPASAAGSGFAKGLTLGLVDTSTPNQVFEGCQPLAAIDGSEMRRNQNRTDNSADQL